MSLSRRNFLQSLAGVTGGLLTLPAGATWMDAAAGRLRPLQQRMLRIGHALPPEGKAAASSSVLGVRFGLEEAQHAARLFNVPVELVSGTDAERLITGARPHVVIGGSSEESCARLAELADREDFLFFNIGCASDVLRGAACHRNIFHIMASEAMQRDAIAHANTSSADAEVVLWHDSLERYGAGQLNPRFHERFSTGMDPDAWAGWIAVKIAAETCFRATSCAAHDLRQSLERPATRFDGHKGRPLSFRSWDHQLRQPLYVIRRGGASREVIEVPDRGAAGMSTADQLDRLGTPAARSACKWGKQ